MAGSVLDPSVREKSVKSANLGPAIVTGGAGAIGSQLVRQLLDRGAEQVIVIDDLSSGYEWLLPPDDRLIFCHPGCFAIFPSLELEVRNALVFHLAAFFANQNSVDHPLDDLHTNGKGTLSVLSWAEKNDARRVVYASAGCSIAGHGIDAPDPRRHAREPETSTRRTRSRRRWVSFYCNYFDQHVSTVRCRFFNSYGPGEVPGRYRNVIPNFIWRALNDEPLVITGSGAETRDFHLCRRPCRRPAARRHEPRCRRRGIQPGHWNPDRRPHACERHHSSMRFEKRSGFSRRDGRGTTARDVRPTYPVRVSELGFEPTVSLPEGIRAGPSTGSSKNGKGSRRRFTPWHENSGHRCSGFHRIARRGCGGGIRGARVPRG